MPKVRYDVSYAGQLAPVVRTLEGVGVPWRGLARRVGLPSEVSDPLGALPTVGLGRLLDEAVRREGLNDVGTRVASADRRLEMTHPEVRRAVQRAPTLYAALRSLPELTAYQGSGLSVWTREFVDVLWVCHRGAAGSELPGSAQWEQIRIVQLIRLIQRFIGATWRPARVHLMGCAPQSLREFLGDAEILEGMRCGAIAVERQVLATGTKRAAAEWNVCLGDRGVQRSEWSLADRVRALLPNYVPERTATVEKFAEMFSLSPRSFQRALGAEGTTFRRLVEDARFMTARALLQGSDLRIVEIAQSLGYSDATHFARAFRRLGGCSPVTFRREAVSQLA